MLGNGQVVPRAPSASASPARPSAPPALLVLFRNTRSAPTPSCSFRLRGSADATQQGQALPSLPPEASVSGQGLVRPPYFFHSCHLVRLERPRSFPSGGAPAAPGLPHGTLPGITPLFSLLPFPVGSSEQAAEGHYASHVYDTPCDAPPGLVTLESQLCFLPPALPTRALAGRLQPHPPPPEIFVSCGCTHSKWGCPGSSVRGPRCCFRRLPTALPSPSPEDHASRQEERT